MIDIYIYLVIELIILLLIIHPDLLFLYKELNMVEYKNIIRRNPNKRFGKPCVRDTRITVYDILGWLATGMDSKDIIKDFPELNVEDIKACLAYAADREHKLQHAS